MKFAIITATLERSHRSMTPGHMTDDPLSVESQAKSRSWAWPMKLVRCAHQFFATDASRSRAALPRTDGHVGHDAAIRPWTKWPNTTASPTHVR
jgi:hypothetical protein